MAHDMNYELRKMEYQMRQMKRIKCMDCKQIYHAIVPVCLPYFCKFCGSPFLMWRDV